MYENCPRGKISLSIKSTEIKNYYLNILSLNKNLIDKICICDTSNGVWSNTDSNELYYQKFSTECPEGYDAESITNHCNEKNQSPVEQDTETNQLPIEEDTESNQFPIDEDTEKNQISVDKDPEKNHPPIEEEKEIHKNEENCPTRYINKCYSHCP